MCLSEGAREGWEKNSIFREREIKIVDASFSVSVSLQRSNPQTHMAVFAVCRTAFGRDASMDYRNVSTDIPGRVVRFLSFFAMEENIAKAAPETYQVQRSVLFQKYTYSHMRIPILLISTPFASYSVRT